MSERVRLDDFNDIPAELMPDLRVAPPTVVGRDAENDEMRFLAFLSSANEEFGEPVPLPDDRSVEAPPFPLGALPGVARDVAESIAASTQTPPDLAGNLLLGAASATVAGKAQVDAGSHAEHLNVWEATILPPGERKSSALGPILAPFYRLQAERRAQAQDGIDERGAELELAEEEFKRLRRRKDTSTDELAAALRRRDGAKAALEAPAQLVVDDPTPEALANDLARNPRLLIASAEGGLLDNFLGRYHGGVPNLDLLNKAWAGEPHTVRRASHSEGGLMIERPTLAIAIAPQPHVMRTIARNPAMTARGTLSRFLVSAPASILGRRSSIAPAVDRVARDAYEELIRELVGIPEDGEHLQILPPAHARIREYRDGLEVRAGRVADDRLRSFLSRMHGQVYRLAGLLHFLAHGADGARQPIGKTAADDAVSMARYYERHAEIALDLMGEHEPVRRARVLHRWFETRLDPQESLPPTTVRDAHRAHSKWTGGELAAALAVLEERDLYRRVPFKLGSRGRPRELVLRNPALTRPDVENDEIPISSTPETVAGACVVPGCNEPGDIDHDGDHYCVSHAMAFGIGFDPFVADIAVERQCANCGAVFSVSADSAAVHCSVCLASSDETDKSQ